MCSVIDCKNMGGHKFSRNEELQKKWLIVIKREKTFCVTSASRVCSSHFKQSDYASEGYETGMLKKLKS